jgi:hypothetical protein
MSEAEAADWSAAPTVHWFRGAAEAPATQQSEVSLQLCAGTEITLTWEVEAGATVELLDPVNGLQDLDPGVTSFVVKLPESPGEHEFALVAIGFDGSRSDAVIVHVSTHLEGQIVSGHAMVSPPEGSLPAVPMITSSNITVAGMGFFDWFNKKVKPNYSDKVFPYRIQSKTVWTQVFDNIPTLSGKDSLTLNEFLAYNFIMYKESAFEEMPILEDDRADSSSPHLGDAYYFAYNHHKDLGNTPAGDQLVESGDLDADKDKEWVKKWNRNGISSYPSDAPEKQKAAARKCDFIKFRGRGLCQITGRNNYYACVKQYLPDGKDIEKMSCEELDQQFADIVFCFKVFNQFFGSIASAVAKVNGKDPDWAAGALGNAYAAQFTKQCNAVLECLKGKKATFA